MSVRRVRASAGSSAWSYSRRRVGSRTEPMELWRDNDTSPERQRRDTSPERQRRDGSRLRSRRWRSGLVSRWSRRWRSGLVWSADGPLMPEQELLGINESPLHVFPRPPPVDRAAHVLHRRLDLFRRRQARQRRHVQVVEDLAVHHLLRQQLADAVVRVPQPIVDRRPIDELQRLRQVAVALAFALAGQLPRRLIERLQEGMIDLAVGELRRACAQRHPGELLRHLGYLAESIEELLRRVQLGYRLREILVVFLVELVALGAQLIR